MQRAGSVFALLIACGGQIDGRTLDATVEGGTDGPDVTDATGEATLDATADSGADTDADGGVVATCKTDGTSCSDAGECCSGMCDSLGACGISTCPNGPTLCEQCIGASCCSEELACAADPSCLPIWTCFKACIELNEGSNGAACVNQCMPKYEKAAYAFDQCGYNACAGLCW